MFPCLHICRHPWVSHSPHLIPYLVPRATNCLPALWSDNWAHTPGMYSAATKSWWVLHSWLIEDPLWDDPRGLHNRISESTAEMHSTAEMGHYALKYSYDITRHSKLLGLNNMPDFQIAHHSTSSKIINIAGWVHSPLDQVPQGEQPAWATHSDYIYHYAGNEMTSLRLKALTG